VHDFLLLAKDDRNYILRASYKNIPKAWLLLNPHVKLYFGLCTRLQCVNMMI